MRLSDFFAEYFSKYLPHWKDIQSIVYPVLGATYEGYI